MAEQVYRFFGTECEIGGVGKLTYLGQSVRMKPEVAGIAIAGGAAILPADDFSKLGFTDSELNSYANAGRRIDMKPETEAKFKAAALRLHEIRNGAKVTKGTE